MKAADAVDLEVAHRVEQLLYHEAALLDAWDLDGWLDLLTADVTYRVLAPPNGSVLLVDDDRTLLEQRVRRLLGRSAHSERPRSRTRRAVTNIRVAAGHDGELRSSGVVSVQRFRGQRVASFVGTIEHRILFDGESATIGSRTIVLDHGLLEAGGVLSFVL